MPTLLYSNALTNTQIRLISFPQSVAETVEELQLSIHEYSLDSLPVYHALSYTWGPPRLDDPAYTEADRLSITINGLNVKVYPNLFDALQSLRSSQLTEHYWIDAICINQDDILEREAQVGIMDRIYKSAKQVDLWLGKSGELASEVTRMIINMAEAGPGGVERVYRQEQIPNQYELNAKVMRIFDLPAEMGKEWEAFLDFFDRSWFHRTWVRQEVALSKSAIALWDGKVIPWEAMVLCAQFLTTSGIGQELIKLSKRNRSRVPILPLQISALQNICHRPFADGLSKYADMAIILSHLTGWTSEFTSHSHIICALLILADGALLTDKRDAVFALLGILNHISDAENLPRPRLRPAYDAHTTVATVFTAVTSNIINSCRCAGILSMITDASIKSVPNLPTWVPDFSISANFIVMRAVKMDQFSASKIEDITVESFDIHDMVLNTRGCRVGRIHATSKAFLNSPTTGELEAFFSIPL
jgi:hypothetical protein